MAPSRSIVSIELLFTVIFVFFRSGHGRALARDLIQVVPTKKRRGNCKKYTNQQENMTIVPTGIPRAETDPIFG